jgi:cytochrome c-type biogenesis protein
MESSQLSLAIAFVAGFLTFFTPCFLPLLPAYLSFITGFSFGELTEARRPKKTIMVNTLFFILGFSIVFVLLGASVTYLGSLIYSYREWVKTIGGIIIIAFGLYLVSGFKVGFFEKEKKIHLRSKPAGYFGSLLVGAAFAAGWTPCVGPILGSILVYAGTSETLRFGIWLLIFYSLGLGLPLFVAALLVDMVLSRFQKVTRYIRVFSIVCGILLICMGVLLIADPFRMLSEF